MNSLSAKRSRNLRNLLCAWVFCLSVISNVLAAWPFPDQPQNATYYERNQLFGLYDDNIGILFSKASKGMVTGISNSSGQLLATGAEADLSLFTLYFLRSGEPKPEKIECEDPSTFKIDSSRVTSKGELRLTYQGLTSAGLTCNVTVQVILKDSLDFRIKVDNLNPEASLHEVRYPQIELHATGGADGTRLVLPQESGKLSYWSEELGNTVYRFPGGRARFPFIASYAEDTGQGLYFGTHDEQGYLKKIQTVRRSSTRRKAFVVHYPNNRAALTNQGLNLLDSRVSSYAVTLKTFTGNWYDAAQICRAWWVDSKFAEKGILKYRDDVPTWTKKSMVFLKANTPPDLVDLQNANAMDTVGDFTPLRALINDVTLELNKNVEIPMSGVWYFWNRHTDFNNPDLVPQVVRHAGDIQQGIPMLEPALDALKSDLNIHMLGYNSSTVVDYSSYPELVYAFEEAAIRDTENNKVRVNKPGLIDKEYFRMSHFYTPWIEHYNAMCYDMVQNKGFSGIYMDSLGTTTPEDFSPNHGHVVGGGRYTYMGHVRMATGARETILESIPNPALMSEYGGFAHVPYFAIHGRNQTIWNRSIEVTKAIYGDYAVDTGTGISRDVFFQEVAYLLVKGHMIGRLGMNGGFWSHPDYLEYQEFMKTCVSYGHTNLNWLRYGVMMPPLEGLEQYGMLLYLNSEEKDITMPNIIHGVFKRQRSDETFFILANVNPSESKSVTFKVDKSKYMRNNNAGDTYDFFIKDEKGNLRKIRSGKDKSFNISIQMGPRSFRAFILKRSDGL